MKKRADGLYCKQIRINGKQQSFYGKTQAEINKKILSFKEKVEKGRMFEEVADDWKEEHFKTIEYNTTKGYNPAIKRAKDYFINKNIKEIKPNDIKTFITSFARSGMAQKTVKNQLLILNLIFTYAVSNNEIEYNPVTSITVPKNLPKNKRELPSEEEITKVKNGINAIFGLFAFFCLNTGCRRGEALAIQYKDFDFANKRIRINKSVYHDNNQPRIKTPKTKAGTREILLIDKLIPLIAKRKKGDDLLFPNEQGTLLTETQFQRQWELYQKETGVKITPHQLRHGYATMLFEAGIDVKDAQGYLGHASITTTHDIYTHISAKRKQETDRKINDYLNK